MPESPAFHTDLVLDIVYRDEALVVINKPAGLLVHRTRIATGEKRFAVQLLRDQLGQRVYPVHRLDRPTSGLLVFALSPENAAILAEQFSTRAVDKTYLAVVRGYPESSGTINHPLKYIHDDYDKRAKPKQAEDAITRYRTLAKVELPVQVDRYPTSRYALLELKPETGRRHQLRRHLKHISHPIIGDPKHGKGVHNRYFAEHFSCSRLLLAATDLSFTHPASGERITLNATLDDTFNRLLNRFGWHDHIRT